MISKYQLLIATCIIATGCQSNSEIEMETNNSVNVKIKEMKMKDKKIRNIYSGTVEEVHGTVLSFSVPGTLKKLYISEGEFVKKGEAIAELDDTSLRNAYEAAEATFIQAKDAYERVKQLYDSKSASEIQWMDIQTKLKQAESAKEIAHKSLKDCILYAPFDGYISKKNVEEGQNIMPGMPVIKLVTINEVKVKITVPEDEITFIKKGQLAKVFSIPGDDRIYEGKVMEKGIEGNPLSHSYEVKIRVDNPQKELLPGMIYNVQLIDTGNSKSFILPMSAISLSEDNRLFVWTVDNGVATKRYIRAKEVIDEGICFEGLKENDLVIIEGQQKVGENTKVNIIK